MPDPTERPDHDALLARYFHQHRRSGFIDELIFAARSGLRSGEVTADDTTDALRLVPEVRRALDRAEVALIESLMDSGWTWEQLGAAYGDRSKQAMQQHYRRRGGHRTWPTGDRQPRTPLTAEESPHRLVPADLDPADVEAVRVAITHLMATAHAVAAEHSVDGGWTLDPDDEQEQIVTIGLEVLPRLEMACRTAAKAITAMVEAGWERRDPGREARRRGSWTVRLDDSLKEMASWLDKLPHGVPLPRFDRPLVLGDGYRVAEDHVEVDRADAERMRASIDQAIAQLDRHRATLDQNIDELRRRRAEITPG